MIAPVQAGPSPVGGGPTSYLTTREVQILRRAANGKTNRIIGRELGVHEETIKTQMRSVLRKLRADDRAQAVAIGLCVGLISAADIQVPTSVTHVLAGASFRGGDL